VRKTIENYVFGHKKKMYKAGKSYVLYGMQSKNSKKKIINKIPKEKMILPRCFVFFLPFSSEPNTKKRKTTKVVNNEKENECFVPFAGGFACEENNNA
jgi:hypothetical protein